MTKVSGSQPTSSCRRDDGVIPTTGEWLPVELHLRERALQGPLFRGGHANLLVVVRKFKNADVQHFLHSDELDIGDGLYMFGE